MVSRIQINNNNVRLLSGSGFLCCLSVPPHTCTHTCTCMCTLQVVQCCVVLYSHVSVLQYITPPLSYTLHQCTAGSARIHLIPISPYREITCFERPPVYKTTLGWNHAWLLKPGFTCILVIMSKIKPRSSVQLCIWATHGKTPHHVFQVRCVQ